MGATKSLQGVFLNDDDGNVVGVILDGSVYRLQSIGKLLNAGGSQINPATQETLASLEGKDFATQTTLATRASEATLASIKDTDGIKKITDALPAGTNNIGDVDVVSSALPTGAATEATLASLEAKDFATQTTLATLATETTLDAIRDNIGEAVASPTADTLLARVQEVIDLTTAIKDTDGVKKITDQLPAGTNNIGDVDLASSIPAGTNIIGKAVPSDGTNDMPVAEDVAIPASTKALLIAGRDPDGGDEARVPTVIVDSSDSRRRMSIEGKVSIAAPTPPAAATPVQVASDTPLDVSSSEEDSHTIPSGKTFTLQTLTAGAEGDTTAKGSKVEVIYVDSGSTEHLVARMYLTGFSIQINPDTSEARDGTVMTGDGVTTAIIVRRIRLGGGTLEIDAVAKGFEE